MTTYTKNTQPAGNEDKIRRGQAYNLAVNAAIAAGKATDKFEIFSFFIYYYELAEITQKYAMEDIRKSLDELKPKEK